MKCNNKFSTFGLACGLLLSLSVVAAPLSDAQSSAARGRTFNVQSYGAKGDGTTDDTESIQNALKDANRQSDSTVYFPPGKYLFTGEFVASGAGITMRGQNATLLPDDPDAYILLSGDRSSILDLAFAKVDRNFPPPITPINQIVVDGARNYRISGNKFDVLPDEAASAVVFHWCVWVKNNASAGLITNNQMLAPGGIRLTNAISTSVRQNRISGNLRPSLIPFELQSIGVLNESGQSNSITDNNLTGISSQNVFRSDGIRAERGSGSIVQRNTINGFTSGIVENASINPQINNNVMTCAVIPLGINFTKGAIDLDNVRAASVINNRVNRSARDSIRCASCLDSLIISQNVLADAGLENEREIGLESSVIFVDSPDIKVIRIQSNRYSGNTRKVKYFIECKQPSPPAVVSGNFTNTMLPNRIGP
ncbi:MAG: glycosyl hydrolase family 28-related protein [Candidatus Obscuribacterales bacterium]|nr:hypothetical protein [Cyanobacteria bacterium SZAS LIN-5]